MLCGIALQRQRGTAAVGLMYYSCTAVYEAAEPARGAAMRNDVTSEVNSTRQRDMPGATLDAVECTYKLKRDKSPLPLASSPATDGRIDTRALPVHKVEVELTRMLSIPSSRRSRLCTYCCRTARWGLHSLAGAHCMTSLAGPVACETRASREYSPCCLVHPQGYDPYNTGHNLDGS